MGEVGSHVVGAVLDAALLGVKAIHVRSANTRLRRCEILLVLRGSGKRTETVLWQLEDLLHEGRLCNLGTLVGVDLRHIPALVVANRLAMLRRLLDAAVRVVHDCLHRLQRARQ